MQTLKIKAFGMLAEKLPQAEFSFPYASDTEKFLSQLKAEYPTLNSMKFRLAVNQQLVQERTTLEGNEEIALLPPFSGG